MCYGSYDPKYMMRDIEDRVKGVAFAAEKTEEPVEITLDGLMIRVRAFFRRTKAEGPRYG